MAKYKQRCSLCKNNWALVLNYKQKPVCPDCEKILLHKPVKDAKMRELFAIDKEFYEQSAFLKSIRLNYSIYGSLTERQVEYFKKVSEELKDEKKKGEKAAPEKKEAPKKKVKKPKD